MCVCVCVCCVCVYMQAVQLYEGLMHARRRHTLTCSPFSQYLIVFLLVTQPQSLSKFMVWSQLLFMVYIYNYKYNMIM